MDYNYFIQLLIPRQTYMLFVVALLVQWGVNSYFFHNQSLIKTLVNILSHYIGFIFIGKLLSKYIALPQMWVVYDLSEFWNTHYIFTICLVMLVQEFFLYIGHIVCHKHPLLWAIHEPHHSVTELNLSASYLQGWFMPFVYMVSSWPMILLFTALNMDWAFLAIPAHISIVVYQMILHSGFTYKNKWASKFFILPGDHAKHHEIEPKAQNSNYGSCLSIYDHLFNTYNGEPNNKNYGCASQRDELNVFKIQLGPFARAWQLLKKQPTAMGKLKLFVLGRV